MPSLGWEHSGFSPPPVTYCTFLTGCPSGRDVFSLAGSACTQRTSATQGRHCSWEATSRTDCNQQKKVICHHLPLWRRTGASSARLPARGMEDLARLRQPALGLPCWELSCFLAQSQRCGDYRDPLHGLGHSEGPRHVVSCHHTALGQAGCAGSCDKAAALWEICLRQQERAHESPLPDENYSRFIFYFIFSLSPPSLF